MENFIKNYPRRIGIDGRFYGPLGKGLGRYIQEIVDNIIKIDQKNEYVVFLSKENFDELKVTSPLVKKVLANVKWYSWQEQLLMPFLILKEGVDLMHFPHFNVPIFCPTKFVVTIHDLILTRFPTVRASTLAPWFYKLKNLAYQAVIFLAIKRSEKVIAVSNFTKSDIVEKFKIKPSKIEVTYEGVTNLARENDSLFVKKVDDKDVLLRYNITTQEERDGDKFILYVGNVYPHKNLESLLSVFSGFCKKYPNYSLVLVGREDYFYKRLKDRAKELNLWHDGNSNNPVIFPGYVPDRDLEVLYRLADFYIFPSRYEGFGLPPLEAMSKGCPVTSSNQSCLPEILGDAALYFDPDDKSDIFEKMERMVSDVELKDVLRKKGYRQVKRYDWWECARRTLKIYESVLLK